ncbi:MAG: 4-hydroxybenzoate octaprenyltransferase [Chromatiales bacterium]|nr:4-hydroxybenzoate octaprenyltransferase [Chromatiales bacterium]
MARALDRLFARLRSRSDIAQLRDGARSRAAALHRVAVRPRDPATERPPTTLGAYLRLMRFDRPIGFFLLGWPTLWALWIAAEGPPPLWLLLVFIAGIIVTRAAGCVINDYADRDIDPHVARTASRPIASGQIKPENALALFGVLMLIALILVLTLPALAWLLAVAGALLAATYPFMKRFHHLPQVHLGAAFGVAVPMAYAAVQDSLPPIAWLLFTATLVWTVAYDTMYAMADREEDLRIGVKSTAILFGEADRVAVGVLQITTLGALALVGQNAQLGPWFYAGLGVAALLAGFQQWLIRGRDPAACFRAFLNNNWFGLAVFAGIALDFAMSATRVAV